ncbi:MAG: hypothetical protein IJ730_05165 [Alphaproteobacteria bacterium]|nr:hypothetical protein [Alphaproteobacteria bacterium]
MMNFNDAEVQNSFDLIPANTIAKARLVIKPGNDSTDPFITRSKGGDTAYLNCEWIILEGKYAKRKVFDKIGLEGSDKWVNMGKARIRAILESAKGINPKDMSEIAVAARQINSFNDLNNLDAVIKIGVEHDKNGQYQDKNRVIAIITPDHFSYPEFINGSNDIPWSM